MRGAHCVWRQLDLATQLFSPLSRYCVAVGSFERMVRPAGERMQKLRAATGEKELADVQPLDSTLRLPPG